MNLQNFFLAVLVCDFPDEVVDARTRAEHAVEAFVSYGGIFGVHKMAKTGVLNFIARISEDPAQCIVEKNKVALDIGLKKSIGNILDENTIAIAGDITFLQAFAAFNISVFRIFGFQRLTPLMVAVSKANVEGRCRTIWL